MLLLCFLGESREIPLWLLTARWDSIRTYQEAHFEFLKQQGELYGPQHGLLENRFYQTPD